MPDVQKSVRHMFLSGISKMINRSISDIALKACKFLMGKRGYVVVCILPSSKEKCPKGLVLDNFATVPLIGWHLNVAAQTRALDFIKQCDVLMQNGLLRSAAEAPEAGSRFFRCGLEIDDDLPF